MGIEEAVPAGIALTTVEAVLGWARQWSLWPLTMGLACCAIEMIDYGCARPDAARWGQEIFRASPRQADLMIVSGRVSQKMAPVVRQLYDQMPGPKWVMAMGACASSGGIFNNYAIIQGADHIVPVDIYVPGCPPRTEQLVHAMFQLKDMIQHGKIGAHRAMQIDKLEQEALEAPATLEMKGLMR